MLTAKMAKEAFKESVVNMPRSWAGQCLDNLRRSVSAEGFTSCCMSARNAMLGP